MKEILFKRLAGIFCLLSPVVAWSQQTADVETWHKDLSERTRSTLERRLREKPDFATDVQFSKPDYIVFIPSVDPGRLGDTYNDHFQVFDKPDGKLFALWCQATVEGALDQHVAFSRSFDKGKTWEPPHVLAGNRTIAEGLGNGGAIASWAFPLVSKSGRIYILYNQYIPGKVSTNRQHTGVMMGIYSDDDGVTWTKPEEIAMPRSINDSPNAEIPSEWVVWQKPLRLGKNGNYLVGVSRYAHPSVHATKYRTVTEFIHFDNVDKNPPIKDLIVRWVQTNDKALHIGVFCEEPSIVKLPDGRLFCVMRTGTGSPCWTQSRDDGETWSEPKALLMKDGGKPIPHPMSPCPIYDAKGNEAAGGLYFLLAHNTYDHTNNNPWQNRGQLFFFPGRYQKGAEQPVWFDEPGEFISRPSNNSFYTSLTVLEGKTVLWYPDQKFYLLGRVIGDDFFGQRFAGHTPETTAIPDAPEGYRRPAGYNPAPSRYQISLHELKKLYSEKMMQDAEKVFERVFTVNSNGKYKPTGVSLDRHKAPEWFEDAKFGMFIDWGLWSVGGWAPKQDNRAMYPDWYEHRLDFDATAEKYHDKNWGTDFERDDLIPFFQAKNYTPGKLIDIAVDAGMKYVVPFCKHHSGFCLWPSSYTHRDAGDRLGKDLVKPLVDNCRAKGLKFGFYFSTDEWEYPVFDVKGDLAVRKWAGKYEPYTPKMETWASGKIAVKDFAKHYIIPQAVEFIDTYDPDILWYDGEWDTPVELLGAYEIAAYFYNRAEGKKEVAVNDRYGRESGKYLRSYRGDFFTSEYGDMTDENRAKHAWEENRGISQSFGFNWQDTDENVISSKDFIDMFVNIVSKGGNLLLIVNLDAQGALPLVQEKRLRDIGQWLKINGEGIYNTRAYTTASEGNVRYTRSKDNRTVYAISLGWPGSQIKISSVKPAVNSQIFMLGLKDPLKWSHQNGVTTITLPAKLQKASNRPCDHAYTFRIQQ